MPLTLVLDAGPGGAGRETRSLSQGTLSIGRSPGNDWVLSDPDRQLSKTHCVIADAGGRYTLTDLSTNGVFVNGAHERIPRDGQIELMDGDDFRIGEYVFHVSETAAPYADPAPFGDPGAFGDPGTFGDLGPFAGHAPVVPGGVARADPFAGPDDLTPDPLADEFGDGQVGGAQFGGRQFGGAGSHTPFVHPISAPPPQVVRAHDPFDLADEKVPPQRIDPEDDDLFQGITPSEAWDGPSQADNADAPMQAFALQKAIKPTNLDDLDFDALLGDTPPDQTPPGQTGPAAAPPVAVPQPPVPPVALPQAAAQPRLAPSAPPAGFAANPPPEAGPFDFEDEPPPVAPPAGTVAAPPAAVAAHAPPMAADPTPRAATPGVVTADAAALLAAFLDGAGVAGLPLGPDPEQAMRDAGAVFRTLVEGIRQVLMSRASIKDELRVERTMLRARDNNALKFSVTAEEAIAALLQPSRPGYKPPLDATIEAFDDVRSHEMAVMAGVQTALMGLLKRFEPATLEKRLEPGMLGSILPSARKARTWELFCNTYRTIATEAQEDFQSVFGREFARAYDAQMQKL